MATNSMGGMGSWIDNMTANQMQAMQQLYNQPYTTSTTTQASGGAGGGIMGTAASTSPLQWTTTYNQVNPSPDVYTSKVKVSKDPLQRAIDDAVSAIKG